MPFETAGKVRGQVHGCRLVAIDPRTRRFVVGCLVDGEYRPPISGPLARRDDDGSWRKFRFEVRVGINVEPGRDGTPKFHIGVEDVRRKEIEGLAGTLAKLLGKYFDDVVTRVAAGKANQLSGKLNAEIVKRVAAFREYGVFAGIDYTPALVVLHFEMSRFKPEGDCRLRLSAGSPSRRNRGPFRCSAPCTQSSGHTSTPSTRPMPSAGASRLRGSPARSSIGPSRSRSPSIAGRSFATASTRPRDDGEGSYRMGYRTEGIACFLYPDAQPGTIPFYRFVDPRTGKHFYTVHPHAEFAGSGLPGRGPLDSPEMTTSTPTRIECRPPPRITPLSGLTSS